MLPQPPMLPQPRLITPSLVLTLALACGGARKEDEATIAKALIPQPVVDAPDEKVLAQRKAEREARLAAEQSAEAQRKAQIDALAVLPAKLPTDLKKACTAVGAAQTAFMQRFFTGETLQKWMDSENAQLQMTVNQCIRHNSLEIAACQREILDKAPEAYKQDAPTLLLACIDKYRPHGDGGAP